MAQLPPRAMTHAITLNVVGVRTTANRKEAGLDAVTVMSATGTSRKEAGPGSVTAAVVTGPRQKKSAPLDAIASERNVGVPEKNAASSGGSLVSSTTMWRKESTRETLLPSER